MKRERTSWQESKGAGGETDYLYYMCAKSQTVNSTTYADRLHLEMDHFKAIWANRGQMTTSEISVFLVEPRDMGTQITFEALRASLRSRVVRAITLTTIPGVGAGITDKE